MPTKYTYPTSDLDKGSKLLGTLGSFWTNVYQGNSLVEGYVAARGQEEAQAHLDLMETVASLSRFEVPLYHTDNWHVITVLESEMNKGLLEYGDGAVFGEQPGLSLTYAYGIPNASALKYGYSVPAPAGLVDVPVILNAIANPTVTLVRGTDFAIINNLITFYTNPFDNDFFAKKQILDGDTVVDREICLWLFKGQFDWQHTYTHFGYVLGLKLASSQEYKDILNAVLDAMTAGTCVKNIQMALAALTGSSVVRNPSEVVELIQRDNNKLVIATDSSAYTYPLTCEPVVAVGDTVYSGDVLVDTFKIYELNSGQMPDLPSISLGIGFLPGDFIDGITFINEQTQLATETVDGKLKVSFNVGGLPSDVELFWDTVHDKGVASGKTLANLLDIRENPESEPNASNLPATVNPLEFVVSNVLRYNAYIVTIKVNNIAGVVALKNTRLFRKIIPPWTTMLVLLELQSSEDALVMDTEGSDTAPGYEEEASTFSGAEPVSEEIHPTTLISETINIRLVSGVCR